MHQKPLEVSTYNRFRECELRRPTSSLSMRCLKLPCLFLSQDVADDRAEVLSTCAGQHRWQRTLSLLSRVGVREDVVTHATAVAACEVGLRQAVVSLSFATDVLAVYPQRVFSWHSGTLMPLRCFLAWTVQVWLPTTAQLVLHDVSKKCGLRT